MPGYPSSPYGQFNYGNYSDPYQSQYQLQYSPEYSGYEEVPPEPGIGEQIAGYAGEFAGDYAGGKAGNYLGFGGAAAAPAASSAPLSLSTAPMSMVPNTAEMSMSMAPAAESTGLAGWGQSLGSILPWAGLALMTPSIYRTATKAFGKGATQQDKLRGLGSLSPGSVGTVAIGDALGLAKKDTANLGLLTNPLTAPLGIANMLGVKGMFGGHKHEDRVQRDTGRKALMDQGFLNPDYSVGLAEGRTFDIGKDSGAKEYNVDFNKEGAGEAVGLVQPLAFLQTGKRGKSADDFGGYYANAVMSGGDHIGNAQALYERAGYDKQGAIEAISQAESQGLIEKGDADSFRNGVNQAFSKAPEQPDNRGGDRHPSLGGRPAPWGSSGGSSLAQSILSRYGIKYPSYKPQPKGEE